MLFRSNRNRSSLGGILPPKARIYAVFHSRSGLLSSVQYYTVADAVRKVDTMDEGKEVPVEVYGKVLMKTSRNA